jgi:hypothetical protein
MSKWLGISLENSRRPAHFGVTPRGIGEPVVRRFERSMTQGGFREVIGEALQI